MTSSLSSAPPQEAASPQTHNDLSYMHRPPRIVPNYGKKYRGGLKLKTCIPRVLLYDNVTQQSMLDVQLSGINSQRYKIGRELEMQRKSFIIRRKMKDKHLTKLTKVEHHDDYWEFERAYLAHAWLDGSDRVRGGSLPGSLHSFGMRGEGRSHTTVSLPDIHSNKPGIIRRVSWEANPRFDAENADKQRNTVSKPKSLKFADGNTDLNEQNPEEDTGALPPISPAVSQTQQFVPRKRVGFRMETGPSGVTRLFHVHPEINEDDEEDLAISEGNSRENFNEKQPDENNNSKDAAEVIGANQESNETEQPVEEERSTVTIIPSRPKNIFRLHSNERVANPDKSETLENTVVPDLIEHKKAHGPNKAINPCRDERFEHLQRLLVKQDPPNDGFIELSPSFVRSYPLQLIQSRFSKVTLSKEDGRRSRYSEGMTPDLSDGQSDCSEEPEDVNHNTTGLGRLGAS